MDLQAEQVNCGTGRDVSDESAAAAEPLSVRWYGDSFVKVPIHRWGAAGTVAGTSGSSSQAFEVYCPGAGCSPDLPVPPLDPHRPRHNSDSTRANPLDCRNPQYPRLHNQMVNPLMVVNVHNVPLSAIIALHGRAAVLVLSKQSI